MSQQQVVLKRDKKFHVKEKVEAVCRLSPVVRDGWNAAGGRRGGANEANNGRRVTGSGEEMVVVWGGKSVLIEKV